jgi:hypothetical protein
MFLLQDTNLPGDLFTRASFTTLAGATGAVYVVCNTIQRVFNYNPKWLALAVSLLVSGIAAFITKDKEPIGLKYVFAVLNGCLIFMAAAGANQLTAPTNPATGGGAAPSPSRAATASPKKRKFFTRWF